MPGQVTADGAGAAGEQDRARAESRGGGGRRDGEPLQAGSQDAASADCQLRLTGAEGGGDVRRQSPGIGGDILRSAGIIEILGVVEVDNRDVHTVFGSDVKVHG